MQANVLGTKIVGFNFDEDEEEFIKNRVSLHYGKVAQDAANAMHSVCKFVQDKLSMIGICGIKTNADLIMEVMRFQNTAKGCAFEISFAQYNGVEANIDNSSIIDHEVVNLAIASFIDSCINQDMLNMVEYLTIFINSMLVGDARGSISIDKNKLILRIGRRIGDEVPFGTIIKITKG